MAILMRSAAVLFSGPGGEKYEPAVARSMVHFRGRTASFNGLPQQRLYFLPLPQGQGSFRSGIIDAGIGLRIFA